MSFIDLNQLGACIAEKQQSDENLSESKNKQSLSWDGNQDEYGAVSPPTGEISIFPLVSQTAYIKSINV